MILYNSAISGNCYKVRLLLAQLGLEAELHELDVVDRSNRPGVLGGLNPALRVPTLVLDDGRSLAESNAILWWLGDGTDFVPTDRFERAQVMQWQFFEQYDHEPNVAVARFWLLKRPDDVDREKLAVWQAAGHRVIGAMEQHLADRPFFVGNSYSIADISLYAYTHVAPEGGIRTRRLPRSARVDRPGRRSAGPHPDHGVGLREARLARGGIPAERERDAARAVDEVRQRPPDLVAAEPARRALQRDDRRQRAGARPHGGGDRVQPGLALLIGLGVALLPHPLDLRRERIAGRQRPWRERAQRARGERPPGEREHHLAGRGRVADRRTAELRDVLDVVRARDEVDGDRVLLTRNVERRGLAGDPHQLLEVGSCDLADVEPGEHGVREPHDPHAEPVAAGDGIVLHEPGVRQRAELARDGAGRQLGASRDLVRPEVAAVGERVEDGNRALRRSDPPGRGLTASRHRVTLVVAFGAMLLRIVESAYTMSLLVTCPNCGPREIHELRCAGESTSRPKQVPTVRELNEYIYFRTNEWGVQREWWFCRSCEDWFLAERDTYTNVVSRTWAPEPTSEAAS